MEKLRAFITNKRLDCCAIVVRSLTQNTASSREIELSNCKERKKNKRMRRPR